MITRTSDERILKSIMIKKNAPPLEGIEEAARNYDDCDVQVVRIMHLIIS